MNRGNPVHSDTLHWLDGDHCLNSYRGLLHFPGVARPLLLLRLPIGVTSEGSKERQLDKVRELKSEAPYFSRIHDIDVLFPLVLLLGFPTISGHVTTSFIFDNRPFILTLIYCCQCLHMLQQATW